MKRITKRNNPIGIVKFPGYSLEGLLSEVDMGVISTVHAQSIRRKLRDDDHLYSVDMVADMKRQLHIWEQAVLWRVEANVLVYRSESCASCGTGHTGGFLGAFQRQANRHDGSNRWVEAPLGPRETSKLPREVKVVHSEAPVCYRCAINKFGFTSPTLPQPPTNPSKGLMPHSRSAPKANWQDV